MTRFLSKEQALQLLRKISSSGIDYFYDSQKHKLVVNSQAGDGTVEAIQFRLPISIPPPSLLPDIEDFSIQYIILLVQSGQCALGLFRDGKNLDHKMFRSYMVRKKQGKSQIKYLKTKGKSRAGSRVRLAGTLEFFENINERLQEYFEDQQIDRIAISCSKTLIPFLYGSKIACPFDKKDEKLFKIPKHIHTPTYEILMDANKFLLKGEVTYEEEYQPLFDSLLDSPS